MTKSKLKQFFFSRNSENLSLGIVHDEANLELEDYGSMEMANDSQTGDFVKTEPSGDGEGTSGYSESIGSDATAAISVVPGSSPPLQQFRTPMSQQRKVRKLSKDFYEVTRKLIARYHKKGKTGDNPVATCAKCFKEIKCGTVKTKCTLLARHVLVHTESFAIHCKLCDQQFHLVESWRKHAQKFHPEMYKAIVAQKAISSDYYEDNRGEMDEEIVKELKECFLE